MTVIAVFCSLFYSHYSNKSLQLTSKRLNSCHSAQHMTPILAKLHMGNSDLKDYTKFCNLVSSSNKQKTQISNKNVRFDNICCNEVWLHDSIQDPRRIYIYIYINLLTILDKQGELTIFNRPWSCTAAFFLLWKCSIIDIIAFMIKKLCKKPR